MDHKSRPPFTRKAACQIADIGEPAAASVLREAVHLRRVGEPAEGALCRHIAAFELRIAVEDDRQLFPERIPVAPACRYARLRGQRQRDASLWTPFPRCGGDRCAVTAKRQGFLGVRTTRTVLLTCYGI